MESLPRAAFFSCYWPEKKEKGKGKREKEKEKERREKERETLFQLSSIFFFQAAEVRVHLQLIDA